LHAIYWSKIYRSI